MEPYYIKYYLFYKYFENIVSNIQNIKLKENEEKYLLFFVNNPHSSAYDIEPNKKILDEKGGYKLNDSAYRQAKNIVNKLDGLKLIKQDKKNKKNSHNKKFYSLTNIGLFYTIRLTIFLRINILAIIRNYPNFKMFKDFLYPIIKLDTLCSENFPKNIHILNALSLYIQQIYFQIENFISYTKNKNDWSNEYHCIWDTIKLRKYLIDKYQYKWLENADDEVNDERLSITYFNNNNKLIDFIEVRLRGNKTSGYLINGIKKKKKEEIIPNMETFLFKFYHFSKKEIIGRSFSNYCTIKDSKLLFSLLSAASTSYTFDISLLFSKDENFIRALEAAKEEFDKLYLAIKNPHEYSRSFNIKGPLGNCLPEK